MLACSLLFRDGKTACFLAPGAMYIVTTPALLLEVRSLLLSPTFLPMHDLREQLGSRAWHLVGPQISHDCKCHGMNRRLEDCW